MPLFGRGRFFTIVVSAAFCCALSTPVIAVEQPPNIVVILLDDVDFDEISPYDFRRMPTFSGALNAGVYPSARVNFRPIKEPRFFTPTLEALAREGATFERFYVTTPACTPSRYSLLTGRYASRSPAVLAGFDHDEPLNIHFNATLSASEPNLIRGLSQMGYTTGIVGKWHNGIGGGLGHLRAGEFSRDTKATDPLLLRRARASYEKGVKYLQEVIGFDSADRIYFGNIKDLHLPDALAHDNLEWITEGAISFIQENAERDPPFFLYVALTVPHNQAQARRPFLYRIVKGAHLSKPARANPLATPIGLLDAIPGGMAPRNTLKSRLEEANATLGPGAEEMLWMDDSIHAILKAIDDCGLRSDTFVLVYSDHQTRGKLTVYEGARVPAFARWPGKVEAGRRIKALSANIDIAPTLLGVAGGENTTASLNSDGMNLMPLLRGAAQHSRESLLLEATYQRAIVTSEFKLVVNLEPDWMDRVLNGDHAPGHGFGLVTRSAKHFPAIGHPVQLYDLGGDVFEQRNIAGLDEYGAEVRVLNERLKKALEGLPHKESRFLARD